LPTTRLEQSTDSGFELNLWTRWFDALLNWRDRLLTNPEFQRKSLRMPFVRQIAHRRMRALFDLCSGFVYSQVLMACTRLRLFDLLEEKPRSVSELAECLSVPEERLQRLLEAAESLELVDLRGDDRYGLGSLGAALLGNPGLALMIEHHAAFYADLADPVSLLRGQPTSNELEKFWAYACQARPDSLQSEDVTAYSELMAESQTVISALVLDAYSLDAHQRLLDVGGGAGVFTAAAMSTYPELKACVFDLPAVCELANKRFVALNLQARGQSHGGTFLKDELPSGYDVVSLIRVLHDHDDDEVFALLQSVRQCIASDGVLLVAEPMLNTRNAEPVTAAYFNFYLMAMGQGRPRTLERIQDMLKSVGFDGFKEHQSAAPLLVRVLTAKPI
jgi:demethylspheroidene O-methyltransferase